MLLENKNPTNAEIDMFKYFGMYLVEGTENVKKYAPVHINEQSQKLNL